jgi:hypothetical protein
MVNFEIDLRFHYESNPSCPGRSFSSENISQNEMFHAAGCLIGSMGKEDSWFRTSVWQPNQITSKRTKQSNHESLWPTNARI